MATKKARKLVLEDEDEEDWDDLVDEDEDDIIDEDEDDLEEEEEAPSSDRRERRGKKGKKAGPPGRTGGAREKLNRPGVKWTGRIIITLIVVFLLFAPFKPFTDLRDAAGLDSLKNLMRPYRTFPEWVEVTMDLSYQLDIRGGRADTVEIQVASPFDIPLEPASGERSFIVQDVKNAVYTPLASDGIVDFNREYNVLSGWTFNDVPPGSYEFSASFDMELHTYEWKISEEDSGTIDDIPMNFTRTYLSDAWPVLRDNQVVDDDHDGIPDHYRYNPSDPRISSIASQVTSGEDTVLGKVKAIYEWITDHFNYTTSEQRLRDAQIYGDMPKWATGCLSDWYGDCDDQSLLMASMCRAVGIPAWLEIGFLYDQLKDEWGGHGWFNVVIPLKDGSDFVVAPIDPVNSEFLFRDPFRITDWIDNGNYVEQDGHTLYNLDAYYNFYSVRRPSFVDVDLETSYNSVRYVEHGKIKQYVDQKLEPGNLQGTQQGVPSLPYPNPLISIPVIMLLIALPARKIFLKRLG
ncbi:hypothetical protein B6U90_03975 [Thermoplasmatales archaeon ex4484_6]|nr:MAG: hypothetical protein B6U90_03975 [Thermoplasmatales archaeon ex4484_6]